MEQQDCIPGRNFQKHNQVKITVSSLKCLNLLKKIMSVELLCVLRKLFKIKVLGIVLNESYNRCVNFKDEIGYEGERFFYFISKTKSCFKWYGQRKSMF